MKGFELDILVVTADIRSPWYADACLCRHRFAVRLTGDAGVAARSAADHPPDVVLIDLGTLGGDADSLVRSLRGHPRGGKPPLVLVAVGAAGSDEVGAAPPPDGVDVLFGRDGPGAGGAVVGALNRLREVLTNLRTHAAGPRGPAAARGSIALRTDRTPPGLGRAIQEAAPANRNRDASVLRGAVHHAGSDGLPPSGVTS